MFFLLPRGGTGDANCVTSARPFQDLAVTHSATDINLSVKFARCYVSKLEKSAAQMMEQRDWVGQCEERTEKEIKGGRREVREGEKR